MTITISKPAINLREQLTELKAQQGYEQKQFHFDNLVTNGTFDTDTSGWTAVNSTLSVASNALRVTNSTTSQGYAWQNFPTTVGKAYILTVDITAGTSGSFYVFAGESPGAGQSFTSLLTGSQSFTKVFIATGVNTHIGFQNYSSVSGDYFDFDNISVYPSDGTDVAFTMPKGWKPLHVFEDGVLQREGSAEDYEVTFDGFNYYVKPTVANPGARNTVIGVRA